MSAMSGIISRFFAAFGDFGRVAPLVHPDVRLVGVRAASYPELPLYGTFVGHDGLRRFMAGLRDAFEPQLLEIDAELESTEIAFACGRFEHRVRRSGAQHRSHFAVVCHLRDHKIVHYRFFEDTAALEEAFGVHTQSLEQVAPPNG